MPIFLIYFEEFSLAEVARLEHVPESTVRSRVKVGLRRLERTLRDLGFPEGESRDAVQPLLLPLSSDTLTPTNRAEWKGCRI